MIELTKINFFCCLGGEGRGWGERWPWWIWMEAGVKWQTAPNMER